MPAGQPAPALRISQRRRPVPGGDAFYDETYTKAVVLEGIRDRSGHSYIREDIMGKKTISSGHCPNEGGGGLPMPEFFGPFSRSAFLVNKKSLFLQKCQCIELLTVF